MNVDAKIEALKCRVAGLEYDKYLNESYGVESCNFRGYLSVLSLKLKIDLLESGIKCNEKTK